MTEDFVSVTDLANFFGVHRSTIDHYIRREILTPDYIVTNESSGRKGARFFNRSTADVFIASCVVTEYDGLEPLLSTEDVSKMLWVTNTTVNNYALNGKLTPDVILPALSEKRGGKKLYKLSKVQAFLAKRGR